MTEPSGDVPDERIDGPDLPSSGEPVEPPFSSPREVAQQDVAAEPINAEPAALRLPRSNPERVSESEGAALRDAPVDAPTALAVDQMNAPSGDLKVTEEPGESSDIAGSLYGLLFLLGGVASALVFVSLSEQLVGIPRASEPGDVRIARVVYWAFLALTIGHQALIYIDVHRMERNPGWFRTEFGGWFGTRREFWLRVCILLALFATADKYHPITQLVAVAFGRDSSHATEPAVRAASLTAAPGSERDLLLDAVQSSVPATSDSTASQSRGAARLNGQQKFLVFGSIALFVLNVFWSLGAWQARSARNPPVPKKPLWEQKDLRFLLTDLLALVFWILNALILAGILPVSSARAVSMLLLLFYGAAIVAQGFAKYKERDHFRYRTI